MCANVGWLSVFEWLGGDVVIEYVEELCGLVRKGIYSGNHTCMCLPQVPSASAFFPHYVFDDYILFSPYI